jgi:hypothetical protein
MRIRYRLLVAVFAGIAAMCEPAFAIGARGGGMPRGGMGGMGGRPGGGMPGGGMPGGGMVGGGARPQMPARPMGGGGGGNFGGSMGHLGGGGGGRPNFNMPSGGNANFNRPSMPAGGNANFNRPNVGGGANFNRPATGIGNVGGGNFNRPNIGNPGFSGPSGALKPALPGSGTMPTTRPANRRPNTIPGGSLPSLDGSTKLPGRIPGSPIDGNRPTTRPGNLGPGNLGPGKTRPGTGRPLPGDVGDFLGMQRPNKPITRPGTLPGTLPGTRPGTLPGKLPGDIAGNRPGINRPRPDQPSFTRPTPKPGITDKGWWNGGNIGPGNPSNRPNYNNIINKRPSWANNNANFNINNKWQTSFNQGNWGSRPNYNFDRWHNWGNDFRHHWGHYHNCHNWFNQSWWYNHRHPIGGWYYGYQFYNYGWNYWWGQPTWPVVSSWFAWDNAPAVAWQQPIYYTYGPSGNVQYVDNRVTVGGETVGSTEEFAQSAATLATVEPPKSEEEAAQLEWLPLGTFAVTTGTNDLNSGRSVQLAVSKNGIISGTAYNVDNDKAQTIQGRVDKETQRVAFRIGDKEDFVAETGLYNLTQNEAPLLVHFGADRSENWMLVRLDAPEDGSATNSNP